MSCFHWHGPPFSSQLLARDLQLGVPGTQRLDPVPQGVLCVPLVLVIMYDRFVVTSLGPRPLQGLRQSLEVTPRTFWSGLYFSYAGFRHHEAGSLLSLAHRIPTAPAAMRGALLRAKSSHVRQLRMGSPRVRGEGKR